MKITETRDKIEIEDAVSSDRVRALYQLGDLDDYYFDKCRWFFVRDSSETNAVILTYQSGTVTFIPLGISVAVEHFLHSMHGLLPDRFYSAWWPEHADTMSRMFEIPQPERMYRMALNKADFRPVQSTVESRVLTMSDIEKVKRLLESYPGNFFEEYQLETGFYRGIFEGDKLIAMAGVHTINRGQGVAALGNVVTDRAHRGRGLGTAVTSHLASQLFGELDLIGLNVSQNNIAAVRAYRRLGFDARYEFLEGFCHKR
jgi:ribosomal protein S18 acetylase RimI-like enzyme